MISTKNLLFSIKDVPEHWLFEHLLKLPNRLEGQEECLISPLTQERTASFTLFQHKGRYFYKCFSHGSGGSATQLAQLLFPDKPKGELYSELCAKYKAYLKGNPVDTDRVFKQFGKYRVDGHIMRNWSSLDDRFWTPGGVSSQLLEKYNVAPLQSFSMTKTENGASKTIHISRDKIYGYFRKTGDVARIYQPGTSAKYLKILPYLQGSDQLKYEADTLLILSGLKDALSFLSLGIENVEVVAPDSENVMINETEMKKYLEKYKHVKVLFDEDKVGIEAGLRYAAKYRIPVVETNFKVKDVFDAVEKYKQETVRTELVNLLK